MSTDDLYTKTPKIIVFYNKSWCPDCRRAQKILSEQSIHFLDIDITKDAKAKDFVKQLNQGNESVPTIIFPDGTYLVEPGNSTLTAKLKSFS
jgi:mycoredoxin